MKRTIWSMVVIFTGTLALGTPIRAEEGAKAKLTPVVSPIVKKEAKTAVKSMKKPVKAVYACPMHPEVTAAEPGKCPKCDMDLVKVELKDKRMMKGHDKGALGSSLKAEKHTYACSMCHVTADKPGKCPMCGMDMVEVKAGGKPAKD